MPASMISTALPARGVTTRSPPLASIHVAAVDLGGAALAGEIAVAEVNGPDVAAVNSFETPRAVDVREHRRALEGRRFEHRFPAHSVSVLRFATQS